MTRKKTKDAERELDGVSLDGRFSREGTRDGLLGRGMPRQAHFSALVSVQQDLQDGATRTRRLKRLRIVERTRDTPAEARRGHGERVPRELHLPLARWGWKVLVGASLGFLLRNVCMVLFFFHHWLFFPKESSFLARTMLLFLSVVDTVFTQRLLWWLVLRENRNASSDDDDDDDDDSNDDADDDDKEEEDAVLEPRAGCCAWMGRSWNASSLGFAVGQILFLVVAHRAMMESCRASRKAASDLYFAQLVIVDTMVHLFLHLGVRWLVECWNSDV